ncbi:hypothetical protein Sru01_06820 [Sphaerisporangium rufum]|uniref:Fibronectin type-III domain-containing protein n=1 Tax=Sphaerisporangium rufum TaxID=1381558 RepID=A0A919QZJ8_9ACTN|nr:fibronectin type III domain-containing protein [Sphaerisporangium rufum]GII75700.1 hypothetical protein Sru01_06820 [Sphaerisporangium rufum]
MPSARHRGAALRGLLIGAVAATTTAAVLGAAQAPASGTTVATKAQAGAVAADTTAPSEPMGLTAYSVPRNGAVGLRWTPSTDNVRVVRYEVFGWKYSPDAASRTWNPVRATVVSVSHVQVNALVTGLTPGTDYLFNVVAVDAAGNRGLASLLAKGTATRRGPAPSPTPGTVTPEPDTDLRYAGMADYQTILITWNGQITSPISHSLFRRTPTGWVYSYEHGLTRTLAGVDAVNTYTWQVVAHNPDGTLTTPSNPYTYVPPRPTIPPTITPTPSSPTPPPAP